MHHEMSCTLPPGYDGTLLFEQLGRVLDPELDEPVLHLGFIRSLQVHDGRASVTLQLPTSWCAANFAYLMADEVRRALLTVESIQQVTIHLGDHFAAKAIAAAVNAGQPFADAFPGEGCGSLDDLRRTFRQKGLTSRQARVLEALRAAGFAPEDICILRVGDVSMQGDVWLARRAGHGPSEVGPAETLRRYLERRAELGLDCASAALLITDLRGHALAAAQLDAYYRAARTVRVSLEANGAFCRAVLEARQGEASAHPR